MRHFVGWTIFLSLSEAKQKQMDIFAGSGLIKNKKASCHQERF